LAALAALGLVIALVLAACGSSSDNGGNGENTASTPSSEEAAGSTNTESASLPNGSKRKLYVAVEDGFCANTLRQTFRAEIEDEARHSPYVKKFTYSCAQGELTKFISDVQSLVGQGVNILVTIPDPGDAVLPTLKKATDEGVTVVNAIFPLNGKTGVNYVAQVVDDHHERGIKAAEYFIEKLGKKGVIVGVGGPPGNTFDTPEIEAMEEVFAEKAPGIEFAQLGNGEYDPAKSAQAMASLIQKYPEINGVWSPEGTTVLPEIQQFTTAGRELPVFVSNEANGMMKQFESVKASNPSFDWGFMPSRTWAMRYALDLGLESYFGKPLEKSKESIKVPVLECEQYCSKYVDPNQPDGYLPTNHVSQEVREEVLFPEMEGNTAPATWTYSGP
jgi:ribose transport system substrate-binding protein